jgi:hypothetical protein
MKFIISILLTALLAFVGSLYFPWWSIAAAAFIVAAVIPQKPGYSFFTGFIALFLLWGILSWWLSNNNGHLLAHKISILILKMDNVYLVLLATALIGALVGGLGALTGSFVRKNKPAVTNPK